MNVKFIEIVFKPIGIIHTPHESGNNTPIQPSAAKGVKGIVEIYPEYSAGLKDLDGFSHIILVYYFHLSKGYRMEVKPFLDKNIHGVFATRAPERPNQIGLSVVRLVKIEKNMIHIENVDIINNTPLLDIKPYIPDFDSAEDVTIGWLQKFKHQFSTKKSDDRFNQESI
jgi:tRNA-Thr(GGU) m(6)t(6)A37 methyltransferase TsaA